jgi:hypothetical protein
MNLTGDPAKQLFKAVRGDASSGTVGTWAAITAVDFLRRRRAKKPARELLLRKKLKPGESYVIRVPGKDEAGMEQGQKYSVTRVGGSDNGIVAGLANAAATLFGVEEDETQPSPEATPEPELSRRERKDARRRALVEEGRVDAPNLRRRPKRKLEKAERRALERPTRRRVRKARKLQRRAGRQAG